MKKLYILASLAVLSAFTATSVIAKHDPATKEGKEAKKQARAEAEAKKAADAKPIAEAYRKAMAAAASDKKKENKAYKDAKDDLVKAGVVGKRARVSTVKKYLEAKPAEAAQTTTTAATVEAPKA